MEFKCKYYLQTTTVMSVSLADTAGIFQIASPSKAQSASLEVPENDKKIKIFCGIPLKKIANMHFNELLNGCRLLRFSDIYHSI